MSRLVFSVAPQQATVGSDTSKGLLSLLNGVSSSLPVDGS